MTAPREAAHDVGGDAPTLGRALAAILTLAAAVALAAVLRHAAERRIITVPLATRQVSPS